MNASLIVSVRLWGLLGEPHCRPWFPNWFCAYVISMPCLCRSDSSFLSHCTDRVSQPYNLSALEIFKYCTQGHAWVRSWALTNYKIKMHEGYGELMHACNQRLFHCRYTIYSCWGWGQYNMRYHLTRLQISLCFVSAVLFLRPACGTGIWAPNIKRSDSDLARDPYAHKQG